MKTLNLITPAQSDIKYEILIFPDSQPHIKFSTEVGFCPEPGEEVRILTRLSNPTDLLLLLIITDCLRWNFGVKEISLYITYLLGARMDRRMGSGEPLTLRVITDLLNAQNYSGIIVYDAHSSVTETLLKGCTSKPPHKFLNLVQSGQNFHLGNLPEFVIFPDEGAAKRYGNLFPGTSPRIHCGKTRDPKTGRLSDPIVPVESLHGKPSIIVDDLCDGGGTFIQLYHALKAKGAGDVYLAISHGIFSKGLEPLKMFKQIFTTNSFKEQDDQDNLKVIKLW